MNTTQTAIIQLLQIYIRIDGSIEPFPKQVDWREVYKLGVKHNIGGILYAAMKKLPEDQRPEAAIQKQLQVHFYAAIRQSEEQDVRMLQVIECLNRKRIFHVLMKGWVLKQYYPIPELRTMGDIDFLIREEDRQRTHEALLELGFLCTSGQGFVWCYQKGNTVLEVHSRMISQKVGRGVDAEEYYLDAVSHTERNQGEYTLYFLKEYHFVYLFAHAAKHFRSAGYGIRGVLDFAVFIQKYQNELNWNYIWRELEKLGLSTFARVILELCEEWFHVCAPFKAVKIQKDSYMKMKEIIFVGGVYGYCDRNIEAARVRDQLEKVKNSNITLLKWKVMVRRIFPERRHMRSYLKGVEEYPVLLPIAWGIRWYQAVVKFGLKNAHKRTEQLLSVDNSVWEEYELLKELDLLR